MTLAGPQERRALITRAPMQECPACRDDGHRLCSFDELLFPDEPEAMLTWQQPRARTGAVVVRCKRGHQYECPSWARTPYGEEYVLARRLQDALPAG